MVLILRKSLQNKIPFPNPGAPPARRGAAQLRQIRNRVLATPRRVASGRHESFERERQIKFKTARTYSFDMARSNCEIKWEIHGAAARVSPGSSGNSRVYSFVPPTET